jgi:hypothetical protein
MAAHAAGGASRDEGQGQKMTTTQIRSALIAKFGARKYRIVSNGDIHVYGTMPNTNTEGWFLFGHLTDRDLSDRLA